MSFASNLASDGILHSIARLKELTRRHLHHQRERNIVALLGGAVTTSSPAKQEKHPAS